MDLGTGRSRGEGKDGWAPIAGGLRQTELLVLSVERALARSYPALARALGPDEVEGLAREFVVGHPFFPGSEVEPGELLRAFLAAALEGDRCRGAWLSELAQLEEALASVRSAAPGAAGDELAGGRLLSFEHRVDELREELLAGGPWGPPRPADVVLAVVGGPAGPRCIELSARPDTASKGRASQAPTRRSPLGPESQPAA